MYVNDDPVKVSGNRGGFAVGGFSSSKGSFTNNFLKVTSDSTRIYVKDSQGGFSVNNLESGTTEKLFNLTLSNYFIGHNSGYNATTSSSYNAFFGYQTGMNIIDADRNVLIGYEAGKVTNYGDDNVIIGYYAGLDNTEGSDNIFIGSRSGYNNTSGNENLFLGKRSGYSNTTGNGNIFLGHYAGYQNESGLKNLFVGYYAGYENETGSNNVFIGDSAGYTNFSGNKNVFIGDNAGLSNYDGGYNVFIGDRSGVENTSGSLNTFVGTYSGNANSSGIYNTLIGAETGSFITEGNFNTIIGTHSGITLTTEQNNVFLGAQTGRDNHGNNNTIIGTEAGLQSGSGEGNVFIGYRAGYTQSGSNKLYIENSNSTSPLIYGDFSTDFIKINGSFETTSAATIGGNIDLSGSIYLDDDNWIGIGSSSGRIAFDESGTDIEIMDGDVGINTTSPDETLDVNGSAVINSGLGAYNFLVKGDNDQYLFNTDGTNDNIGIGDSPRSDCKINIEAGQKDNGIYGNHQHSESGTTSGINYYLYNTYSSSAITYGIQLETARNYGSGTLYGISNLVTQDYSSSGSSVYGVYSSTENAGSGATYGMYSYVNGGSGTDYNIYATGGERNYFDAAVAIGTTNPGSYKLYVSGNAYTTGSWGTSDVRFKTNIVTLENSLDKILKLRGVHFNWKLHEFPDKGFNNDLQIGVIAQEVEEIFPELVNTNGDGYKAVAYDKFTAVFIQAFKEQQAMISQLQKENKEFREEMELLKQNYKK